MLIRLKYSKKDEMAFVSHLDLLRIFIRALRRANIELEYSKGFHPHPKISFSPALSLGIESICEFVDIETKENYDLSDIKLKINNALPNGIEILEIKMYEQFDKIANISNYSQYEITFDKIYDNFSDVINNILNTKSIIINKKSKKGKSVEVDVRDRIYEIKLDNNKILVLLLNSNNGALKPYEFIDILNNFSNEEYIVLNVKKVNIYNFNGKEMNIVI